MLLLRCCCVHHFAGRLLPIATARQQIRGVPGHRLLLLLLLPATRAVQVQV
jgi:hypothetical protein